MTKIKIILLIVLFSIVLFSQEFSNLVLQLSIYEDSIQTSTDSMLINLFSQETRERMTDWISSDDYIKRSIAVRVLSKFTDKTEIKKMIVEKNIDSSYGFRIFYKDTLNYFDDYETPLKVHQYESFILMAGARGNESDIKEIFKIIESKNLPDYILVQALNQLLLINENKKKTFSEMNERFFANLFRNENTAIDEKAAKLFALNGSLSADSLFPSVKSARDKINLVRIFTAKKDIDKLEQVAGFYRDEASSLRFMLEYEIREYINVFDDSLLLKAAEDEKYSDVKNLLIKTKGASNAE